MSAPDGAAPDGVDLVTAASADDGSRADGAPEPARPRRRRRWLITALTVLVLVVVATGWLVFRGMQAATALVHAEQIVTQVRASVTDANTEAVTARLPELEADAGRARSATSDPIWHAAAHLPVVGPNFAAVATISAALDDVTRVARPALDGISSIGGAKGLRGTDGRIDLKPLADAAPAFARAASTVATAEVSVAGIKPDQLLGPLAGPVKQAQSGLAQVSGLLTGAAQVSALLPPMLGADGPRTYLLLSLNDAELRSAGGIVGAVAVLHVENGAISLVGQRSTLDFPFVPTSVLPLTDAELAVYTDKLGRSVQNSVMTPDFPRTAEIVTQFWRNRSGGEVDGVISADPVVVSYLLKATGAVVEPGGLSLNAGNFLDQLLHQSYLRLPDPVAADGFFAGVASTIFHAIGSGKGDARKVVDELGKAGSEHRMRVWSAHPAEEKVLARTPAGGAFLSGGADGAAGVFLNDGTAGKVDYFLRIHVSVEAVRCEATSTTAVVRVDLAYDPPAGIAGYPRYVTGFSRTDLPTGWVAMNLTAYAPVGGTLVSTRLGAGTVGGQHATERGREVELFTSRFAPGEHATYRFEFKTPGATPALPVWLTPTLTSSGLVTASCG